MCVVLLATTISGKLIVVCSRAKHNTCKKWHWGRPIRGPETAWTIIGCIALPLAPKCIWQLPAPLRRTVWSTHSYNRHLNKWKYWQKLNGAQLMLPRYYRGWGLTSCLVSAGYCFPERGRSALIALLISSGSLFIMAFSCPSRRTPVCWVHAGAVRALNASMFRSISWLASSRLHVS